MRQNAGATAGMVALLAFAVHAINPPAGERPAAGGAREKTSKSGPGSDKDEENAREGPWLATRAFFGLTDAASLKALTPKDKELDVQIGALTSRHVPDPNTSGLGKLFGVPGNNVCLAGESHAVVATVADPLHTRLALLFDGQIDAIERAAETDNWAFARQWLPWTDPFDGTEHDINVRRQQRRLARDQEQMPGIMIFRGSTERAKQAQGSCLFVLLVPETPTAGVAGDSFRAALNIGTLLAPQNKIGVLGPTFSGSFQSLAHATQTDGAPDDRLYRTAYGGSVTGSGAADLFRKQSGMEFVSGTLSDKLAAKALRGVMIRYDLAPGEVARLVEQESGYSGDSEADSGGSLKGIETYNYPRDISHLRNAYQRASVPSAGQGQNPVPWIELSLNDPNSGEDSIPDFSGANTPAVQSAQIGIIAEELKRKRTRLVYLDATNSLDELFLAQYLHQQVPDARVLIGGDTDLLFVPAAAQRSLAGTLFLSTYPMFFEGDQALATPGSGEGKYSLRSAKVEGLFNAAQLLLWHMQCNVAPKKLRAYGGMGAAKTDDFPGFWLLELTRFGFSPLDWVKAGESKEVAAWLEARPAAEAAAGELPVPLATTGWYITSVLTSLIIAVGFVFFLTLNQASTRAWPVWKKTGQFPLFADGCLFAGALPLILGIPLLQDLARADRAEVLTLVALGVSGAMAVALPLVVTMIRNQVPFSGEPLTVIGPLLWATLLACWLTACSGTGVADSFFRWRAMHLYSTASPAIPYLLICLIMAGRLMSEFYRRSHSGDTSPHLEFKGIGGIPALAACYEETGRLIRGAFRWSRFVWCLLVTSLSAAMLSRELPAFGQHASYNLGLEAAVAVIVWSLASLGYDAIGLWQNLSKLLTVLESIPLKAFFPRVARNWPRRQVWAFWKSTPQQALAAQMAEALHNRGHAAAGDGSPEAQRSHRALAMYFIATTRARFAGNRTDLDGYVQARLDYERAAAAIANRLFIGELWPKWKNEALDKEPEESEHSHAADFVALQCCNFLTFAVRHTQRIVWSISFMMVMLIAVLNSYSPQGPMFIGRYAAVLLVAAGLVAFYVFTGMERNWILSHISKTKPGELNIEFWLQITAMGALPLIAVVVHLFPDLATFLYSYVAPGIEAAK